MLNKISLYFNTLKYLKPTQVYFRGFYFLRNRFIGNKFKFIKYKGNPKPLKLIPSITPEISFETDSNFTFLNLSKEFVDISHIDWNYDGYGKLWCYNLNYFDFLNHDIPNEVAHKLIKNYINSSTTLKDGLEPYPISIRNINWIKFLASHKINDSEINNFLYSTYLHLYNNLEYHLLGNHLLENAFSLLYGAYYFQDNKFFIKATRLLKNELEEQILRDGAHFELSPMYHQTLLFRLLDCINLTDNNWNKPVINTFLRHKATLMLSWLQEITFNSGNIPHLNDSIDGIAPPTGLLSDYAKRLQIPIKQVLLNESGYRMIRNANYELVTDIGNIGPDYIPGHAHSDTFNFALNIYNKPIIVDTGISTYERGLTRDYERGTAAHNTVMINNIEQSQVWAGFRVAKRAKILHVKESKSSLRATHNGYKSLGIIHSREWSYNDNEIVITDNLQNGENCVAFSFLHFHKDIDVKLEMNELIGQGFKISYENSLDIHLQECQIAAGFNKTYKSTKAVIRFNKKLVTRITLI